MTTRLAVPACCLSVNRRALRDDPSVVDDDDAGGEASASSRYWVVSSTVVPCVRAAHHVPHDACGCRIEPGGGFVEERRHHPDDRGLARTVGPRRPSTVPGETVKLTPSTAVLSPNRLTRSIASMAGAAGTLSTVSATTHEPPMDNSPRQTRLWDATRSRCYWNRPMRCSGGWNRRMRVDRRLSRTGRLRRRRRRPRVRPK